MRLSEEVKQAIKTEYESWFNNQYGTTTKEEREKLGAVFTPPEITIAMIERLPNLDGDILDSCCGSGNLLVGCILAGADPNKIYGNEFDARFVELAQQRLGKLGVPWWHIHQGDATKSHDIIKENFGPDYKPYSEPQQINLWDFLAESNS